MYKQKGLGSEQNFIVWLQSVIHAFSWAFYLCRAYYTSLFSKNVLDCKLLVLIGVGNRLTTCDEMSSLPITILGVTSCWAATRVTVFGASLLASIFYGTCFNGNQWCILLFDYNLGGHTAMYSKSGRSPLCLLVFYIKCLIVPTALPLIVNNRNCWLAATDMLNYCLLYTIDCCHSG